MRIIWFITLFTASGWLYMLSTFTPAKITLLVPFISPLFFGIIAASVSFRKMIPHRLPIRETLIFFIPLILIRLTVPYPYSFGAMVMMAGLLVGLASNRLKRLAPLSGGFLLTGLILLIQSLFIPVFYVLASRWHEIKLLNLIAYPFVRVFGLNASMSEGVIYLPTFTNLLSFPGTLEKTGFYVLLLMMVSGMILFALFDRNWKKVLKFFGICIGYTFLRYVFMIFVYAQVDDAAIYWDPVAFTLSYVPLACILCMVLPLGSSETPLHFKLPLPDFFSRSEAGTWNPGNLKLAALFFVSVFCFVGLWGFEDPGTRKQGRILIDEKHSNWEWTTRKFDTTWFGSQSTYNYYCMAEYFNYFYKVDRNVKEKLTEEFLSEYDILILKTPTMAYEDEEIEDIVEFVRKGGGLWLIGDHTNVFGMNYYLNFIAKRFGMFFHYDSTYDLDTGRLTFYKKPTVFPHPVVQNMPPFLFATSCTVDASLTSENIMLGYGLRSRLLSYSDKGFFERKPTSDYEFGLFLQAAGLKYGKGRVASYTDSTCFSNFYMFIPGKPELAMGTVEWLNRKNKYGFIPVAFGIIGFITLFLGLNQDWREKRETFCLLLFSALWGIALGIPFFTGLSESAYSFPEPHTDFKKVCFETEHSKITLPVEQLVDKHPDNYHTFYVWTQRMGYVPMLEKKLSDALKKGEMVVVINPVKPFTEDEVQQVISFVEKGGRFLLLDGPQNKKSVSNQLLKPFEMKIDFSEIKQAKLYDRRNEEICTAKRTGTVEGGTAFIMTDDKKPVFSVIKRGKGLMGVMADSFIFGNPQMGGTQISPDQTREQIYSMEFYMIDIMGNRQITSD